MPRLLAVIVRHASYERPAGILGAHLPYGLTAKGCRQAREGGERIAAAAASGGWRVHPVIDSSSLRRAWETARIIAQAIPRAPRAKVEPFDALNERSLGAAANLAVEQIERIVAEDPRWAPLPPRWRHDSEHRLPLFGAESLLEAGRRVADHIEQRMSLLRGAERDLAKVFVGHSGAFRHAAVHLGLLTLEEAARLSMDHATPIVWEYGGGSWRHQAGQWKRRRRSGRDVDAGEWEAAPEALVRAQSR